VLKDAHLGGRNVNGSNKAWTWKARILANDNAGEVRKLLLNAILLNWTEKVTNAGENKPCEACNHVVGEYLAVGGSKGKDAPKLLGSLFACHGMDGL